MCKKKQKRNLTLKCTVFNKNVKKKSKVFKKHPTRPKNSKNKDCRDYSIVQKSLENVKKIQGHERVDKNV